MNLNIPGGGTLAFAMLSNGNAKFVEVDARETTGRSLGNHGEGGPSAFSTAKLTGDYAFGLSGQDQSNNHTAIVGRFNANGMAY